MLKHDVSGWSRRIRLSVVYPLLSVQVTHLVRAQDQRAIFRPHEQVAGRANGNNVHFNRPRVSEGHARGVVSGYAGCSTTVP